MKKIISLFLSTLATSVIAEVQPPPYLSFNTGDDIIYLAWGDVENIDYYKLYYAPFPYEGEHTINSLDLNQESYFWAQLWEGASFYVAVTSVLNGEESAFSEIQLFNISHKQASDIAAWSVDALGESAYLGCWYCQDLNTNSNSIHNLSSVYGNSYGASSIHASFTNYGNSFSNTSACSTYALNPPTLQDSTTYYGRLSINTNITDSICNSDSSYHWPDSCELLKQYCEH